jgi:hypothetical protein
MPLTLYTHVWAVPGQNHIIDQVNPTTGVTDINGDDAATVQAREPGAVLMTWDAFMTAKAARQQTPIVWEVITAEQYDEWLGVLPPIEFCADGFMVSEPCDHCAATGRPRYQGCRQRHGRYEAASRPMTRAEFRAELRRTVPRCGVPIDAETVAPCERDRGHLGPCRAFSLEGGGA